MYLLPNLREKFWKALKPSLGGRSACQKTSTFLYRECRGDHWSPANLAQQRAFRDGFLTRHTGTGEQCSPLQCAFLTVWPPSAREVPRRGGGREPCHGPKYFGQPYSSLPHRLRAEPPRRGGQGVNAPFSFNSLIFPFGASLILSHPKKRALRFSAEHALL